MRQLMIYFGQNHGGIFFIILCLGQERRRLVMMWTVIQHGVEFGPAFGQNPGVIDEAVGELF